MEWISVEDRLPKIDAEVFEEIVVLATDGHSVCTCQFDCGVVWCAWNAYNNINGKDITHWMPLPEPPSSK